MSVEEFKSEYSFLYASILPSNSTIKNDLEYVSNHWSEYSYDPWEETYGSGQFFNTIAFREALSAGAKLADKLDDKSAAEWYRLQLSEVDELLESFWDPEVGYIKSTVGHSGGVEWKIKHLDSSVLIAVLFANSTDANDPYSICLSLEEFTNNSLREGSVEFHRTKCIVC
jgi:glucoamylase